MLTLSGFFNETELKNKWKFVKGYLAFFNSYKKWLLHTVLYTNIFNIICDKNYV